MNNDTNPHSETEMKDTHLYEQLLGLKAPWHVSDVRLDVAAQEIAIKVECNEAVWACPACGQRMHVHQYEERRWRHLDTCECKTYIVMQVPRVICATHGSQTVQVPWAEPYCRSTRAFERRGIDALKATSTKTAAALLGMTWDEADGIKQRAVARGLARKEHRVPEVVCFDEKAVGRGHDYMTIVVSACNNAAVVEHVAEGRTQAAADSYWRTLSKEERRTVEFIGMDMWPPYYESAVKLVPDAAAKIVYDRFHITAHMNTAVDEVRRQEHRDLLMRGDARLKGTRQMWLYGFERLPRRWKAHLRALAASTLKTAAAWRVKELLREMYTTCTTYAEGRSFFAAWYREAMRTRLEPVMKVARMCKEHLPGILTYFIRRVTNAFSEGINNLIQSLIKKAYGYRKRERFKTDILFHAGGLNLYPA